MKSHATVRMAYSATRRFRSAWLSPVRRLYVVSGSSPACASRHMRPQQLLAVALGQVLQQQPAAVAEPRAPPVQLRAAHQVSGAPDAARCGHGGQVGGARGPERRGVVRGERPPGTSRTAKPCTTSANPRASSHDGSNSEPPTRAGSPVAGAVADSCPRAVSDGTSTRTSPTPSIDRAGRTALGLGEAAALRHDDGARGCAGAVRPGPVDDDHDLVPRDGTVLVDHGEVVHVERVQGVELVEGAGRVEAQLGGRARGVGAGPVAPGEDHVLPLAHVRVLPGLLPTRRARRRSWRPAGSARPRPRRPCGEEAEDDDDGDPAASPPSHPCCPLACLSPGARSGSAGWLPHCR